MRTVKSSKDRLGLQADKLASLSYLISKRPFYEVAGN